MSFVSAPLATTPAIASGLSVLTASSAEPPSPRWWRVPMVWVVIAGPLSVVIASLLTAVIAWRHIDPVIIDAGSGRVIGHASDEAAAPRDPNDPLAPALRGRNHSATARAGTQDVKRP